MHRSFLSAPASTAPEGGDEEDDDGVDLQPPEQHAEGEDPFSGQWQMSVVVVGAQPSNMHDQYLKYQVFFRVIAFKDLAPIKVIQKKLATLIIGLHVTIKFFFLSFIRKQVRR
jgi:hypothetical protein